METADIISPTANENPSEDTAVKIVKSVIWRHARTKNGYFLDISKIVGLSDQQHLDLLDAQYKGSSNFHGISIVGKAHNRYLEVYPVDEIAESFFKTGVYYESLKTRLLPCKAVQGQGTVIQLSLSEIPFWSKEEILKGLECALKPFGVVLDIGLNYESRKGWFMGGGYATIQQQKGVQYKELTHTIRWGDNDEYCYATFPDMPTWCRYCHSEGHTKYECPKAMAGILCYSCDLYGHRAADCPKPKIPKTRNTAFRKLRKTPLHKQEEEKRHPVRLSTPRRRKTLRKSPVDLLQPLPSLL